MKHPEHCESIEDVRQGIDALDRGIIARLGRHVRYVEAAARIKTCESDVRAPHRQRMMLAERRRWAEESGLDPDVIEDIYRTLISYFIDREMQRWRET